MWAAPLASGGDRGYGCSLQVVLGHEGYGVLMVAVVFAKASYFAFIGAFAWFAVYKSKLSEFAIRHELKLHFLCILVKI
ncbi:hypothetical protein [Bartonella birtlesii]|uniref:hypothetical protein n=1 Tax=Bartonella birtlesii TaxID=111504 RepID=UPI0005587F5A|nr:hypothetical protein [Bartonella birtlesii]